MKKHLIRFLTFCLVTTFTFSFLAGQTPPGIHLGRLEFVRPPEGLPKEKRELKMSMSKTRGITSSFATEVGGVAFVQVAQPSFEVESFSLQCDPIKNSAYAVINGQKYLIPLEVWQLKPIVAYANSEYDAAVSLFGRLYQDHGHTDTIQTVFHNAFVDNLLGLRLLQADLLLADKYMQKDDRFKLPAFDGSEMPILAESEKTFYNPQAFKASSRKASKNIDKKIKSIGEEYSSYVFTDFVDYVTGDSMHFNIVNNRLKIEGRPYYYFIYFDKTRTDTLETLCKIFDKYDEIFDAFLEDINNNYPIISPKISNKLNFQNYKSLSEKVKRNNYNGAITEFRERYNHIPDSTTALSVFQKKRNNLKRFISIYKINNPSEYHQLQEVFEPLYDLTEKILIDEDNTREVFLLSMYWNLLVEIDPNLTNKSSSSFPTFDDFLICYFCQYPNYQMKELTKLTNAIMNRHDLVRNLNPIVYDAAVATCQWTAFFRYAKENYSRNWDLFVNQVKKLKYDVPEVYTPTKLKNR